MNNAEINTFIKRMEEFGDFWEKKDVERVYGDVSLDDALQDRLNDLKWFKDILNKIVNGGNNSDKPFS